MHSQSDYHVENPFMLWTCNHKILKTQTKTVSKTFFCHLIAFETLCYAIGVALGPQLGTSTIPDKSWTYILLVEFPFETWRREYVNERKQQKYCELRFTRRTFTTTAFCSRGRRWHVVALVSCLLKISFHCWGMEWKILKLIAKFLFRWWWRNIYGE